jgi:hypothetical protein
MCTKIFDFVGTKPITPEDIKVEDYNIKRDSHEQNPEAACSST